MRVDVTVLDHRGQPVPALKAEDFLIEEDGVPQKVTSLKFVEANGQPTDDLSLPIRSPEHAAAEAAREDVRVFLIFWDEYSIDQFASAIRAREALTRLLTTAFQPTDLVALMDQLTPSDAIRFTRDFNDLSLDIKKLRGRLGVYIPARSAAEEAQMQKGDPRKLRAEVTASALKSAVVYLGTLREGRKTLIFVSEGIRGLGTDSTQVLSDVVRAANESNTAIYTVDPRGLTDAARRIRCSCWPTTPADGRWPTPTAWTPRCGRSSARRARSTSSATRRSGTRRTAASIRSRSVWIAPASTSAPGTATGRRA